MESRGESRESNDGSEEVMFQDLIIQCVDYMNTTLYLMSLKTLS